MGNVSWMLSSFSDKRETLLASLVHSEFRYSTYMFHSALFRVFLHVFQGSHRIGPGLLASGSRSVGLTLRLAQMTFPGDQLEGVLLLW